MADTALGTGTLPFLLPLPFSTRGAPYLARSIWSARILMGLRKLPRPDYYGKLGMCCSCAPLSRGRGENCAC
jgi:hypothetical protein